MSTLSLLLKSLPESPGVYFFYDKAGALLYVGKAKNLKKRVNQYFSPQPEARIAAWIDKVTDLQVMLTNTEVEALLLESNSIKHLVPKFNIDLRDDKSYPYLLISNHDYPRISYERGINKNRGRIFGPYPSAGAVKTTVELVQKLFQLRSCQDSFFKHRKRPCLQYQIKRCTAPCVGYVSSEAYQAQVNDAVLFLEGKKSAVMARLVEAMQTASAHQAFEEAARLRDQIAQLRQLQEAQIIVTEKGDLDVMGLAYEGTLACLYVLMIRDGCLLGGKAHYVTILPDTAPLEMLEAVMRQYYVAGVMHAWWPEEIILPLTEVNWSVWEGLLSQLAGKKILIKTQVKTARAKWVQMASENARQSLDAQIARQHQHQNRLSALATLLGLTQLQCVLAFDISHWQGQATYAACVALNQSGLDKKNYRVMQLPDIPKNDDYAAMKEAVRRVAYRIATEQRVKPELIVIDGGRGQLGSAYAALCEAGLSDIALIGLAKGPLRKAGLETLWFLKEGELLQIDIPPHHPVRHVLQQIRDEAHRFSLKYQRQKSRKKQQESPLSGIPGVGPKKQQALLAHFGGISALMQASEASIAKVPGIGQRLASVIYQVLHFA